MKLLRGLDALPARADSAVTIGTFDGVHVGHRALVGRAVADATERGLRSVVLTWDRHPLATLRPGSEPPLLTSLDRKLELLADAGVDAAAVLAFDRELSQWPPERFARDVLAEGLGARSVWVGRDWRFGHRAAGDVALLRALGRDLGFETHGVELAHLAGGPASSSRARAAVAAGDLDAVAALLGRPFDLEGTVVHGEHRGRALGYPTANLLVDERLARPPRGVYAGDAILAGRTYRAAISVGVNPTFGGEDARPVRIEVHLLRFDADIYGRVLRLVFRRHLRDERRFDTVEALVAQMAHDVREADALT